MANELLWTGLLLIVALPALGVGGVFLIAGAIIMTIGVVALWLNK